MATFKIETTAQLRRIYIVEAENADAAENAINEDAVYMAHEYDISEEIDSVKEVNDDPPVTGRTPSTIA